ncbi:YcxB family protein [Marinicella rhabdoformis]|uniref:YcxB family protein n=1 Tax=Marinicella rhabdoformis TaxID=2580566 RepID=UPI0012AEBC09|nr:YcxB family protein [Marinicella rhabdoformis]
MEIKIKYSPSDYLSAVRYKFNYIVQDIKKTEYPTYIFLKIASPLIIIGLTIKASVTRLKPEYTFHITEKGVKRSHNEQSYFLPWSRIISYCELRKLILLEFINDDETSPSHQLLPKKYFNKPQFSQLMSLINNNHIPHGLKRNILSNSVKN